MEIEEVAAKHPEKILKVAVDPAVGFQSYQGRLSESGATLLTALHSHEVPASQLGFHVSSLQPALHGCARNLTVRRPRREAAEPRG